MRMPRAALLVMLTSSLALGQSTPPQQGPPSAEPGGSAFDTSPAPAPPPERSWAERCLQRPVGWYGAGPYWRQPIFIASEGGVPATTVPSAGHGAGQAGATHAATPVGGPGASGGSAHGLGDAAALIVVAAVAVVVVLPFVIYAFDEPASEDVLGRASCPQLDLDVRGGIEGDRQAGLSAPLYLRARASDGWFGVQAQLELAPWSSERTLLDGSVAAWLRFTPSEHVELGFTVGYRSLVVRDAFRPGLEVALPHEYVFWREGAKQLGLELRPGVFIFHGGVDLSIDFALRIPVGELASVVLGGRVFTVDAINGVGGAALGGLSVRL